MRTVEARFSVYDFVYKLYEEVVRVRHYYRRWDSSDFIATGCRRLSKILKGMTACASLEFISHERIAVVGYYTK